MSTTETFDLVIRGGTVVNEYAAIRADVYISDGHIAALADPDAAPLPATEVVDATGLHVLPGIIDAHTHFRTLTKHSDNFAQMARSAAYGGITTVLAFIMGMKVSPMRPLERAEMFVQEAAGGAAVDYGFHLAITDEPNTLEDLPKLVDMGISSFKMFMAYRARGMQIDDGMMLEAMQTIHALGGQPMIHAEAGDLADKLEAGLKCKQTVRALADGRPAWVEAEATRRALLIAEKAGSVPYFVHVSCGEALAEIGIARARGQNVIVESCPQYLNLSVDDFERLGVLAKIAPPLRERGQQEAMVAAILAGQVQVVGSDHAPYTAADKQLDDVWAVPMGAPGTETLIVSTWRAIHQAGGDICELVRVLSAEPSRIFGMYPSKGVVAVGSLADLTLVDLRAETVVDGKTQHNTSGYSVYEGLRSPLAVHSSFLRGRPLLRGGELVSEDLGAFVPRGIAHAAGSVR
ncbi:amidohydrolase family protein [Nocardia sp. NPDC050408]|uniref:amidohydrolase family protein n=1 Tax=Nocardia sp. NPDC050408 TaxID=3364319 RepID=UPI0037BB4583